MRPFLHVLIMLALLCFGFFSGCGDNQEETEDAPPAKTGEHVEDSEVADYTVDLPGDTEETESPAPQPQDPDLVLDNEIEFSGETGSENEKIKNPFEEEAEKERLIALMQKLLSSTGLNQREEPHSSYSSLRPIWTLDTGNAQPGDEEREITEKEYKSMFWTLSYYKGMSAIQKEVGRANLLKQQEQDRISVELTAMSIGFKELALENNQEVDSDIRQQYYQSLSEMFQSASILRKHNQLPDPKAYRVGELLYTDRSLRSDEDEEDIELMSQLFLNEPHVASDASPSDPEALNLDAPLDNKSP